MREFRVRPPVLDLDSRKTKGQTRRIAGISREKDHSSEESYIGDVHRTCHLAIKIDPDLQ